MRHLSLYALWLSLLPVVAHATEIVHIPYRAMIDWRGNQPNAEDTIYAGAGLSLTFSSIFDPKGGTYTPVLHLKSANGERINAYGTTEDDDTATGRFGIGEVDPKNDTPEVVFTSYTGGVHCCTLVVVLSHTATGWVRAELGPFNGNPAHEFPRDVDGDGIAEIVTRDLNFDYAFTSHAGSEQPPVVYQVRYGRAIVTSKSPRYSRLFQIDMARVKPLCLQHGNGACAAFVADAARLGQRDQAWAIMLRNYDRNDTWTLPSGCSVRLVNDGCPEGKDVKFTNFPDALKWFLTYYGY